MEETEHVGRTCLYKDGKAVVYEGEAVAAAMEEGWLDHPVVTGNPAPKPTPKPEPAPAPEPVHVPVPEPAPKPAPEPQPEPIGIEPKPEV